MAPVGLVELAAVADGTAFTNFAFMMCINYVYIIMYINYVYNTIGIQSACVCPEQQPWTDMRKVCCIRKAHGQTPTQSGSRCS